MKKVAAGMAHSGCVTEEGKVYIWGLCGDAAASPSQKKNFLHKIPTEIQFSRSGRIQIEDLKLGENFSVALGKKGEVFTWGANDCGQLGLGDIAARLNPEQVQAFPSAVIKIAVGLKHCVAITRSHQVYAWGQNDFGQMGQSTQGGQLSPILLQ